MQFSLSVPLELNPNSKMEFSLLNDKGRFLTEGVISSSTFVENLSVHPFSLPNALLSPAVRYLDLNNGIIIFERPPSYARLNYSQAAQNELEPSLPSGNTYNIALPWQRYAFMFGENGLLKKAHIFFSSEQISVLHKSTFCAAPLPNLFPNSALCQPQLTYTSLQFNDVSEAIFSAWDLIWGSGFNADISHGSLLQWVTNQKNKEPLARAYFKHGSFQSIFAYWASHYTPHTITKINWDLNPVFSNFSNLIEFLLKDSSEDVGSLVTLMHQVTS